jgi:hypothetical protein
VEGLLNAWLNLERLGGIEFFLAPKSIPFDVPSITGDGAVYETAQIALEPSPGIPIDNFNEKTRIMSMSWPPKGLPWPPVSIEGESLDHYGPLERSEIDRIPVGVGRQDSNFRSLHLVAQWPAPLSALLPLGSGIDEIMGQAGMAEIARRSHQDLEGAIRDARNLAAPYLSDGETTLELARFRPIFLKGGSEGLLFDLYGRFDLYADTLEEAFKMDEWREVMDRRVPVRRAGGALGLFWALLLEHLEGGRTFRVCQRCGRIFRGKRDKQFCGPREDLKCYRARRASNKRRERGRPRTR